jgi:hypothetical protein
MTTSGKRLSLQISPVDRHTPVARRLPTTRLALAGLDAYGCEPVADEIELYRLRAS